MVDFLSTATPYRPATASAKVMILSTTEEPAFVTWSLGFHATGATYHADATPDPRLVALNRCPRWSRRLLHLGLLGDAVRDCHALSSSRGLVRPREYRHRAEVIAAVVVRAATFVEGVQQFVPAMLNGLRHRHATAFLLLTDAVLVEPRERPSALYDGSVSATDLEAVRDAVRVRRPVMHQRRNRSRPERHNR